MCYQSFFTIFSLRETFIEKVAQQDRSYVASVLVFRCGMMGSVVRHLTAVTLK